MVQKAKGSENGTDGWYSYKKYVKHFSNRKDRQATRQAIHHERYDDIPHNRRVKEEDSWCWD